MSTTALWGANGSVKWGGTAGTAVNLVDSWDMTFDVADLDITSVGDTWQTMQAGGGLKKVSGSIKVKHSVDDVGGSALMTQAVGGTPTLITLYESSTTCYWQGTAALHPSITVPAGDKQSSTFSFTSSGAWTHTVA